MVYTVTFHPALDYVVRVRSFQSGETNRAESKEQRRSQTMIFESSGVELAGKAISDV